MGADTIKELKRLPVLAWPWRRSGDLTGLLAEKAWGATVKNDYKFPLQGLQAGQK